MIKALFAGAVYLLNNCIKVCRFSMANYRRQDWMVNVPLYFVKE